MNITLPSLGTVTKVIAGLPDFMYETAHMTKWNFDMLLERINGTVEEGFESELAEGQECDDPSHDHAMEDVPFKPWEAARHVLEFLMLVRSHEEFHKDFHTVMAEAAPEIDSPQHALDVVLAAVHMLWVVTDDDDIEMFRQTILDAGGRQRVSDKPKVDVPTAMRLLIPARETRMQMDKHGGFNPMVLYKPRKGIAMMAILEGEGRLHDMLAELLAQMRPRLGPAEWIAVTTDAYMKPTDELEELEPGILAKRFAEGDPSISEQMVVILRSRYKPTEIAAQSYRYLPSEGWEWDEPEEITEYSSLVTDILNYYI